MVLSDLDVYIYSFKSLSFVCFLVQPAVVGAHLFLVGAARYFVDQGYCCERIN